MKSQNQKSIFIRQPEGHEILTKQEILHGLQSKETKDKETALNHLILTIINDQYADQQIMNVLNYIVPYQDKTAHLKKQIILYWEIINKHKLDGKLFDEFILASNNLRKDLMHANEFVVSITLKLISRIAVREIIEVLMQPIYEFGLKHTESFVRRNTIECLFYLFIKFGEEVVSNLDIKLPEFLAKETDITTKRNAMHLLFLINKDIALSYIQNSLDNEGIDSIADITQICIINNLFSLCRSDKQNIPKYLKLIYQFFQSKFSSVQFEISNQIYKYTQNPNVIQHVVNCLLKILQETPDINIKIIIIEQLEILKQLSSKYIEGSVNECIKIIDQDHCEVKIKLLKMITNFIDQVNIDYFMHKLIQIIQKEMIQGQEELLKERLLKYIIKSLVIITKKIHQNKLKANENLLCEIFSKIVQINTMKSSNCLLIKQLVDLNFYQTSSLSSHVFQLYLRELFNIQNSEILSTILSSLVQEAEQETQIELLLKKFEGLNLSLNQYMKKQFTLAHQQQKETGDERLEAKAVTKTVIREDGTYGTEILYEPSQIAEQNIQYDKFKHIIHNCFNNQVFLVNFFRNLIYLVQKLGCQNTSKKQHIHQITHSLFQVYKYLKLNKKDDPSVFTELNILIKQILSTENIKIQQEHRRRKLSIERSCKDEDIGLNAIESQFDDDINFRLLQSTNLASDFLYEDQIVSKQQNTNQLFNDSFKQFNKMKNVIQLTGYSDPIYIESLINYSKYNMDIELLILNRMNSVLKNVVINFYSFKNEQKLTNLKLIDKVKLPYLMPDDFVRVNKTMQYDINDQFQFFSEVSYQNNAGLIMGTLKTNIFRIQIQDFLFYKKINQNYFRQAWQICQWENKIKINKLSCSIEDFLKIFQDELKMILIKELAVNTEKFNSFSFYSKFLLGKEILINITIDNEEGGMNGLIRLRSQNLGAVVLVEKHIRKMDFF